MPKYHAVMLDETRCEFGVDFEADSFAKAYDYLQDQYPESTCVQLETPKQAAAREKRLYDKINRDYENGY